MSDPIEDWINSHRQIQKAMSDDLRDFRRKHPQPAKSQDEPSELDWLAWNLPNQIKQLNDVLEDHDCKLLDHGFCKVHEQVTDIYREVNDELDKMHIGFRYELGE